MDDVITLISITQAKNDYGVWEKTLTETEVLCQVRSITRQEYFEAGRGGLNPSFLFIIFAGNYNGESICRFHGDQYSIYRSYHVPGTDYLELYVERKGGTNTIPSREGADDGTQQNSQADGPQQGD